jgi:hypothetical protein
MWKHALRIYEKTVESERQFSPRQTDQGNNLSMNSIYNTTTMAPITAPTSGGFARTTIHYVGALIACSKLGFWKQARREKLQNVLYNVANPSSNEDFETLHYERLQ